MEGFNNKKETYTNEFNSFSEHYPSKYLNGGDSSVYFGVHIPPDVQIQDSDGYINVFEDKNEALKVVKKYKKARFKAFSYYHEAAEFAVRGSENPNNNISIDGPLISKQIQEVVPSVGEKPSQFRGPTSQNLVKLRKEIESGDLNFVQKTIWENPRYLIGVGDTPSILQEGFRYNGLHVAAKSKNAEMCELILNTISNIKFIKKLYVDDKDPEDRAKILLDLYLNTPDKGLHETPLHFAVKFGADKCVEVLVSFPQCDKNLRNKYGNLPNQIICDRYDAPDSRIVGEKIAMLLQDNYYVPVLRSEDNCTPPVIGEPFSPTQPPSFNTDPLNPRLEIHAYAGPMNKEGAEIFRKIWKSHPRTVNDNSKYANKSIDTIASLKLKDHEKGLERLGNNLAKELDVAWKEYWPFLDSFVDIASEEGLELFEAYLKQKFHSTFRSNSSPNSLNNSGTNSPPKIPNEISPMTELCNALQACTLNDNRRYSKLCEISKEKSNDINHDLYPFFCIDKSLQVFAKRISNDILYLLDVEYDTCSILEMQIKHLQDLMSSYMDDTRFSGVDVHVVHARLAYLIKSILCKCLNNFNVLEKMIDLWLEFCSKNYDCFSSDDEGVQNPIVHSKSQHTMCILKHIQEFLSNRTVIDEAKTEEDCMQVWKELKPCTCNWKSKSLKKCYGSKRSNSFKFSSRNPFRHDISRKLSFNECDNDVFDSTPNMLSGDESESSEDEFFTPPSTPSLLEQSDDEDLFDETHLPDLEMFIEGDFPSKMDYAVYNAFSIADSCKLNPKDYPNVYKWRHAMSLYIEKDPNCWSCSNKLHLNFPPKNTSTPCKAEQPITPPFASPKSWLRITGVNSPRASLKHHKGNVSFNL